LANPNIIKGGVLLDCKRKTIEVGEGSPMMSAVAAMTFTIGHLFLKRVGSYSELFGEKLGGYRGEPITLAEKLVKDGVEADKLAASWSSQVLQLYWGVTREEALDLVYQYVWDERLWSWHFLKSLKKNVM
jgi:hypothetical protein